MLRVLTLGLILALLTSLPFYSWVFAKNWFWASGFPLGWLTMGMAYMSTFFHEIGHTIFMWFYGYPTVPAFDFKYGGGWALALSEQSTPLLIAIWAGLAYAFWYCREYRPLQILIVGIFLFNISLAFTPYHAVIIDFMGPAFESLVAGFLLYRAIFNLAPRGAFERFLNAYFGFGMILSVFINAYGLLKSEAYRLVYYQQKGSHGFGDFDKIDGHLPFINFEGVVSIWLAVNVICLLSPFVLWLMSTPKYDE